MDGQNLQNVEAPDGDCEVEDFVLVYEYPSAADVGVLQENAAGVQYGASEEDARAREQEAKEVEQVAEAEAVQQVAQMESDHEKARQLRREMEEEEAAKLSEQERLARELQKQLEDEERAAMQDIRAAQEREIKSRPQQEAPCAGQAAAVPYAAGQAEDVSAAQRRLSLDPDTWSLVLQVTCLMLLPPLSL